MRKLSDKEAVDLLRRAVDERTFRALTYIFEAQTVVCSDIIAFATDFAARACDAPDASPIVRSRDDHEMNVFLHGVIGIIEATSNEQQYLWQDYRAAGRSWKARPSGLLNCVGHYGGNPVCIAMHIVEIDDRPILFYHATSQVVDNRLIEAWLEAKLPVSARRQDGKLNKTDATNAHLVASFK